MYLMRYFHSNLENIDWTIKIMCDIKTIIIDDARLVRTELKKMLEIYPRVKVIGEAANGRDAITLIKELKPALVFLDIQMPFVSGLEVLQSVEVDFQVIFISSYGKYLPEARNYDALDFLMKPINKDKLGIALKKMNKQFVK